MDPSYLMWGRVLTKPNQIPATMTGIQTYFFQETPRPKEQPLYFNIWIIMNLTHEQLTKNGLVAITKVDGNVGDSDTNQRNLDLWMGTAFNQSNESGCIIHGNFVEGWV